jgi:hypothetical protein
MAATVSPLLFEEETILEWFARHETVNYAREGEKNSVYLILNSIIRRAEAICNRSLVWQDHAFEDAAPYGPRLYLSRLPIADVQSLHAFLDYNYGSPNLIDPDAYFIEQDALVLKTGRDWAYRRYRATYSGGYSNYGAEPFEFASGGYASTPLPDDLAQAILTQLNFEYANRAKAAVRSVTDRDGSVTWNQPYEFLPVVRQVLQSYRADYIPQ